MSAQFLLNGVTASLDVIHVMREFFFIFLQRAEIGQQLLSYFAVGVFGQHRVEELQTSESFARVDYLELYLLLDHFYLHRQLEKSNHLRYPRTEF